MLHLGWLGAENGGAGAAPGTRCTCRRRGKGIPGIIVCFGQRWSRISPVRAEPHPRIQHLSAQETTQCLSSSSSDEVWGSGPP